MSCMVVALALKKSICIAYCIFFVVLSGGRVWFDLLLEGNKQNNLLNLDQLVLVVALSLMSQIKRNML